MDVLMPQLGETVAEGKITKWFKSAGDAVKPGDNLFEIETDKVSMEVPSITDRHADRDPRAGRRDRAGRRRGRGDRGRGRRGCERASAAPPPASKPRRRKLRSLPRKREPRARPGPRVRGDERIGRRALPIRSRSVLRGAHARRAISARRRLAGGTFVTPLARRLAGENGIDLVAHVGLRPARPHRRGAMSNPRIAKRRRPRRAAWRPGASADAGQGALPGRRVRGGAARRHARDHRARGWSRPSRPSRISISPPT